jgi:hypothetical protein
MMRKQVMVFLLVALAALSGALLVDFSPALPRHPSFGGKQSVSGLPGALNRRAAVAGSVANHLVPHYGKLPLDFEANQGQADAHVKFLSRGSGYALFLTGDEAVLTLRKSSIAGNRLPPLFSGGAPETPTPRQLAMDKGPRTTNAILRMHLVGANPSAAVTGADELPGKSNYFKGSDPKKWRTNVPNYARVEYAGVYPGVDLVYYGNRSGELEYDFVVAPGANPSVIALDVTADLSRPKSSENGGAKLPLQIAADGDLVVKTDGGEVRFHKPAVYQPATNGGLRAAGKTTPLEGHYLLQADNRIRFQVSPYDHAIPLVIDPVLTYSTYLGGTQTNATSCWPPGGGCSPTPVTRADAGLGIAVDSLGNAYVTGYTDSTDFPTVKSLQAYNLGNDHDDASDAFVTKFNAAGSALVYSTYLGGSSADYAQGIAVDSAGNAYVTGTTISSDFPIVNSVQATCDSPPTFGGGCNNAPDAFVAELNPTGSALVYSTYLGGTNSDWGQSIAVDSFGSAYVTGYTDSTNFPTTTSFQSASGCSDCFNAFVAKLNPAGAGLAYSTYLGGSTNGDNVEAYGIAVDASGEAYVTGWTLAQDFPTVNPIQATNYGQNVFVSKLNAAGSALVYSTYLGGHSSDYGEAIAVDSSGSAYVTGTTDSADFPTVNPIQSTCTGCTFYGDAFVTKLNAAGSALVYSTYLGGSSYDLAWGIAVDSSGNAYVTGQTYSTDFPTANPIQANCDNCTASGTSDAFVAKLNAAGSALIYSTYLGGSGQDVGLAIAAGSSGHTYVTGQTASTDFPLANPLQNTCAMCSEGGSDSGAVMGTGFSDAFVAMLSPAPVASLSFSSLTFPAQLVGTSRTQTVTLTNTGDASLAISSITASPEFSQFTTCGSAVSVDASCTISVTFTPLVSGTTPGAIDIYDNAADSPQTIVLSGTGVVFTSGPHPPFVPIRPPSYPIPGQPGPVLPPGPPITEPIPVPTPVPVPAPGVSLAPSSLAFSTQIVGTHSSAQTLTLVNTGNAPLTLAGIAASANFVQTNNCGEKIAARGSCTISLSFAPTAAGSLSGTLTITDNSNGAAGSQQSVTLTGTGTNSVLR